MNEQTGYHSLLLRKYLEELEAKYPEYPLSYPDHDADKISFCHYLEVDRLYRDFLGSRTHLVSFVDGEIELEAFLETAHYETERHPKQRFYEQVESWFANRFLRKAKRFRVHVYASRYPGAFTRSFRDEAFEIRPERMLSAVLKSAPDIKVDEWSARLGVASQLIETPDHLWPEDTY